MARMLFGSIPSPSNGVLDIGPLSIHVYGILLAIGVVVAATHRRATVGRGGVTTGTSSTTSSCRIVIGGVVGARLYHVATDYEKFEGDWLRVFEIWKGGLSIWGVVVGGCDRGR